MSLAAPWPLKIVLDNVVGHHPLPALVVAAARSPHRRPHDGARGRRPRRCIVLIAVLGAVASYIDNYYTESVGQYVANDLRMRVYHHLHRLSLGYYDTHQIGNLLSTITTDVTTIQNFASGATLGILVDILTIVGMLGVMFWLNFDFALIAVARDAVPAALRHAVQEGGEEGDARGAAAAERHRRRGAGGARIGAGRQGVRPRGARGGAPQGREPGGRRRGAQGPARQVAAVAGRHGRRLVLRGVRALARARRSSSATP